jgi:hypothetical protein
MVQRCGWGIPMDRGKWEIRGEVRKWTDVPLHIAINKSDKDENEWGRMD